MKWMWKLVLSFKPITGVTGSVRPIDEEQRDDAEHDAMIFAADS